MASMPTLRAADFAVSDGVVAGRIAAGGSLLDDCFPRESSGRRGENNTPPRQILIRITIAELSGWKIDALSRWLPGQFQYPHKGQTLVLSSGDGLFDSLASLRDTQSLTILAEPVFCVQSGMPAHARFEGGEFPTLSPLHCKPGKPSAMAIGFQRYGTDLEVTPRVLPDRTIRLTLSIRQTCPDPKAGTRIRDVLLPGLSARAVIADAEMPSGKTLLLYTAADAESCAAETGLLVLATARLVCQGTAATHLAAAF